MFKSKIFLKAMLVVTSIVVIYAMSILLFIVPKMDNTIQSLEEKNAKEILNKVVTITKNVSKDLESYKKIALQKHKDELKNLTDTVWSIIYNKYEQSKPKNLHNVLKKRGERFRKNLNHFYNTNKNKMTTKELKEAVKNYTKIYRHNSLNTGYFWINDFKATMIMHPIKESLNGKNLWNYQDPNGVYLFRDFALTCKDNGAGIVKYQWNNPNTNKIEDKISYVFAFEPFGWIFGTGEYYSELQKKFQDEVIEIVNKIRYQDNNYFFLTDYNSIIISHPYLPKGKDFSKVKDKKGNLIVPPMVKIARNNGEGFTSYWWKKNKINNTPYEKLSFSKDFPNWKMIIGTGVYIDDINKEIGKRKKELMSQLRQIIKTTKIEKTGYLYIFDGNYKMLIHPNSNIDGKDISKLKNPGKNTFLFHDLSQASKTKNKMLHYKWDKPSDKGNYIYDKVSWVEYIPELDWYIASSAYVDELQESSSVMKNFILWLSIIIFLLAIVFSYLYLKNLLTPISILSQLASTVTNGDYSVRSDIKSNDEVGILSLQFNNMVNTIEDNIKNLDNRIAEKTSDLEKAKLEVEAIHKHTRDSIEYASLIQGALIPLKGVMEPYFKDHFVTWTPKDTVGGDIWLFDDLRHEDECLIFAIDCTGHGVPGAFVTMIVKAIEREIVSKINKHPKLDISPAIIMGYFNKTMKKLLRQETKDSLSNAGFDGGIIYYNRRTQLLKFAGAETPLFYITKDGEFKIVKGNRYSVGYKKCKIDYEYKETIIKVEEGMKFFCTTDGYLDQNGGIKDFPFGKKRFSNIIKEYYKEPMAEFQTILQLEMMEYETMISNNDRNDDMTVIGFEIGPKSDYKEDIITEIFKYEGIMTQNVIATAMDNIESKITNMGLIGTISTITIEYCQNMMNYSKGEKIGSGEIEVQIINNESYKITATNVVSKIDKEKIEPKLIEIQGLDKAGIKARYKELRRSGENTHGKGGGIGMYEIAKVSNSIEYKFTRIDDEKYYFTMSSVLKSKNNIKV